MIIITVCILTFFWTPYEIFLIKIATTWKNGETKIPSLYFNVAVHLLSLRVSEGWQQLFWPREREVVYLGYFSLQKKCFCWSCYTNLICEKIIEKRINDAVEKPFYKNFLLNPNFYFQSKSFQYVWYVSCITYCYHCVYLIGWKKTRVGYCWGKCSIVDERLIYKKLFLIRNSFKRIFY